MRGAGAFAACAGFGGCGMFASQSPFEYENDLRDRCWVWGHDTGQVDGEKSGWGLDVGKVDYPISEGARFLGCPNIKVIVNDDSGKLVKVKATDLLPFAWQPVEC